MKSELETPDANLAALRESVEALGLPKEKTEFLVSAIVSHKALLDIATTIVSRIGDSVDNDEPIDGSAAVDFLANVLLPRARIAIEKTEVRS